MTVPLHVAYVSADRGISVTGCNGASTHVREMAAALVGNGAAVTILVPRVSGGVGDATVIPVDTDAYASLLRRLTARMAIGGETGGTQASEVQGLLLNHAMFEQLQALHVRRPVDLVYERYSLWCYAGLRFAREHRLPFLLEVNAPLAAQQEEYRGLHNAATARALERLLLAHADRVIVPSQALAEYVLGKGTPVRRVQVVPCGVGPDFFAPPRPVTVRRPGDPFVVGFLGSLKPWHGIEILLKAFGRLLDRRAEYRLLVVGDGPLRPLVESFERACPVRGAVTCTGSVAHREVPRHLARMDVGLAPYPGLPGFYFSPLKIFEYAAAGVPIVASASGQIAEILEHRSSALLHPPGSARKIVAHVEELYGHPELGERLARRAQRVVARAHTWDRLARRVLRLAESLRCKRAGAAAPGADEAPTAAGSETEE